MLYRLGSEQEGIDRLAVKSFEALLELSRSLSSASAQPTADQVSPEVRHLNSHRSKHHLRSITIVGCAPAHINIYDQRAVTTSSQFKLLSPPHRWNRLANRYLMYTSCSAKQSKLYHRPQAHHGHNRSKLRIE